MKRVVIYSLVVLNVALIAGVCVKLLPDNPAFAQNRRVGDYMMIPGNVAGEAAAVVFVIDSANGELGAMAYDDAEKSLKMMPPIDLHRVFDSAFQDDQESRKRK